MSEQEGRIRHKLLWPLVVAGELILLTVLFSAFRLQAWFIDREARDHLAGVERLFDSLLDHLKVGHPAITYSSWEERCL